MRLTSPACGSLNKAISASAAIQSNVLFSLMVACVSLFSWRFGIVVASRVAWTKLLYVEPIPGWVTQNVKISLSLSLCVCV